MNDNITLKTSCRWLTTLFVYFSLSVHSAPQVNVHKEMIEALEAYADFKMGNHQKAFKAWKALAEKDNTQGIFNTANMYLAGEGTNPSCSQALRWYRRGVELGDPLSMYSLGRLYIEGQQVEKDEVTGLAYLREAGAAGVIEAQQWLTGYYLEQGDKEEAVYWLQRASDNGDHQSSLALKEIPDSERLASEIKGPLRASVHSWLKTLDDAANQRDANTLTANLLPDATIKIKLPGQNIYQTFTPKELNALWQNVFSTSYRYRFTRTDYEVLPTLNGMEIRSTIRENILADDTVRILKTEEVIKARLNENRWEITALKISARH